MDATGLPSTNRLRATTVAGMSVVGWILFAAVATAWAVAYADVGNVGDAARRIIVFVLFPASVLFQLCLGSKRPSLFLLAFPWAWSAAACAFLWANADVVVPALRAAVG